MEASATDLKVAVERMHHCSAQLVESVQVSEVFEGKPVWNGIVHIFDLTGHPSAKRAYAWSEPKEGKSSREFFAVLHLHPVDSPLQAVRASIVDRQNRK